MNISSRCEYACRAVIELALNAHNNEPVTATTLAERRSIPEKYLVHILLQLKRAGIVRSLRGARGGYLIARAAEGITLLDIVSAVDGPVLDPLPVTGKGSAELTMAWKEVAGHVSEILAAVSIQSIIDRKPQGEMYYI